MKITDTEQVKVGALGSALAIPVVAHDHSLLPALHVASAQSPVTVPYVEFLLRYQEAKQFFHKSYLSPRKWRSGVAEVARFGLGAR